MLNCTWASTSDPDKSLQLELYPETEEQNSLVNNSNKQKQQK